GPAGRPSPSVGPHRSLHWPARSGPRLGRSPVGDEGTTLRGGLGSASEGQPPLRLSAPFPAVLAQSFPGRTPFPPRLVEHHSHILGRDPVIRGMAAEDEHGPSKALQDGVLLPPPPARSADGDDDHLLVKLDGTRTQTLGESQEIDRQITR